MYMHIRIELYRHEYTAGDGDIDKLSFVQNPALFHLSDRYAAYLEPNMAFATEARHSSWTSTHWATQGRQSPVQATDRSSLQAGQATHGEKHSYVHAIIPWTVPIQEQRCSADKTCSGHQPRQLRRHSASAPLSAICMMEY